MTVAAHRRLLHLALAGAVLGALLGCGSSDFTDPDHVRTWANTASAVAVYVHADQPVAFADKQHTFKDASCPSTTDDGTTVTIGGECLDSTGRQWLGQATVVRSGTGDKDLTLKGYGSFNDPNMKAVTDGTVQLRRLNDTLHTFNVDLVKKGGMTTTIQYNGEVQGGYDAPTTWSGSGSVQRQGLVAPTGTVQATTVKQLLNDDLCVGQAASGQTSIVMDDHTAVITYDGAQDCDKDKAARWRLDGEDMGLITGITCAAGVSDARHRAGALLLLAAGLVLLGLRRMRSHAPP